MWANCLRHLPDDGITVAELRGRARTGTNLDGMRRWGYVTFTPDPGANAFAALRAELAGLLAQLDPALPDCLPILRHGLFSRPDPASGTPGTALANSPAPDLPLWALLSRPLLAFATQYEAEPGPSLAVSANVLRVLAAAGVPASDIPGLGGVSKESVAMAVGWLRGAGRAAEGPDPAGGGRKVTTLTPRGVAARDEYPARAAGIERDWRARFGDGPVSALRRSIEPLLAGDPPPLAAGLAPYPMTLHRGGYPDGS